MRRVCWLFKAWFLSLHEHLLSSEHLKSEILIMRTVMMGISGMYLVFFVDTYLEVFVEIMEKNLGILMLGLRIFLNQEYGRRIGDF